MDESRTNALRKALAEALHDQFAPIACVSDQDIHTFAECDIKDHWLSRGGDAAAHPAVLAALGERDTATWQTAVRRAAAGSEPRIGYCSRDYPHSHTSATLIGADEQPRLPASGYLPGARYGTGGNVLATSEPAGLLREAADYIEAYCVARPRQADLVARLRAALAGSEPTGLRVKWVEAIDLDPEDYDRLVAEVAATPTASPKPRYRCRNCGRDEYGCECFGDTLEAASPTATGETTDD